MKKEHAWIIIAGAALALAAPMPARAIDRNGYELSVLVDGSVRPEHVGRGTTYVEALRGRDYTLRLANPFPYRVAVALSVDGLNTIDARHTAPAAARKWVLDAYETLEIDGWQVNDREARRFYFTAERDSYGAWLGKTRNLGVIEAVFFRERRPIPRAYASGEADRDERLRGLGYLDSGRPSAPAAEAERKSRSVRPRDEYAATGIGERLDHGVHQVHVDLESSPAAVLRIRYEFRPALVRLGILPRHPHVRPLDRRETARGFDGPYCPDPRDGQ